MSREIMQQALDALENAKIVMGNLTSDDCSDCMYIPVTKSIAALEQELAKPEQELPTLRQAVIESALKGYGKPEQDINILHIGTDVIEEGMHLIIRRGNEIIHSQFYEAPKRQWVGLTDEEIKEVLGLNETSWSLSGVALQHVMDDARALEAKLKEKNGG
jgi:hypothetical protein